MRYGFTLMEMQAALFLGLVVSGLAFLLLRFEAERNIRVEQIASLRQEALKLDATLQYTLAESQLLEWTPQSVLIQDLADQTVQLSPQGFQVNHRDAFLPDLSCQVESVQVANSVLKISLSLSQRNFTEHFLFSYLVPASAVVKP
ncbi:MAG: hypothetical protein H6510_16695 [Acidobacteria bacterium]|nr:hypothetical protein [Acidobacteriota bacterium]MCB9399454.1 hypothetical protein [Acidobacteriota bacterium]